jgi:plastocyanin
MEVPTRARAPAAAYRHRKDHVVNPSRRSLLAAVGGSFLLAGCSSNSNSTSSNNATGAATGAATGTNAQSAPAAPASGSAITIQNFAFSPATLTVPAGTTVMVSNKDSVTHTVTASDSAKSFNTGDISANAMATFKAPSKPGTYPYHCTIHTFMHGTLTVQ